MDKIPEKDIAEILLRLGFLPHMKGYRYALDALMIIQDKPGEAVGITTHLYPAIAKKHGSTPQRVERAIRHSIEICYEAQTEEWKRFVSYYPGSKGRPAVGWVLFALAEMMRLKMVS